ncbi:MAG: hypothetical protein QM754_21115 [Tepidisphaeraceae bacterium]
MVGGVNEFDELASHDTLGGHAKSAFNGGRGVSDDRVGAGDNDRVAGVLDHRAEAGLSLFDFFLSGVKVRLAITDGVAHPGEHAGERAEFIAAITGLFDCAAGLADVAAADRFCGDGQAMNRAQHRVAKQHIQQRQQHSEDDQEQADGQHRVLLALCDDLLCGDVNDLCRNDLVQLPAEPVLPAVFRDHRRRGHFWGGVALKAALLRDTQRRGRVENHLAVDVSEGAFLLQIRIVFETFDERRFKIIGLVAKVRRIRRRLFVHEIREAVFRAELLENFTRRKAGDGLGNKCVGARLNRLEMRADIFGGVVADRIHRLEENVGIRGDLPFGPNTHHGLQCEIGDRRTGDEGHQQNHIELRTERKAGEHAAP